MKNARTLFHEIVGRVTLTEQSDEVESVVLLMMENVFRLSRTDIMAGKEINVSEEQLQRLDNHLARINRHEPIQYVLEEAWFYERRFRVNKDVLIPRPETEELVRVILDWKEKHDVGVAKILDIGTGSGCIPVTLALEWPDSEVFALEVSAQALEIAKQNAADHGANIRFMLGDILRGGVLLKDIDIVVSNPPYIAKGEEASLLPNVAQYEPHLALFVPDDDPLIFYRVIGEKGKSMLREGGLLAFEINERYADEVAWLLESQGWNDVEKLHDLSGKLRIVTAIH